MYRIAVMGDRDSIYGFAAVGLDIYPVDTLFEEPAKLLKRLATGEYAVIYITEALAKTLAEEIEHFNQSVTPAIIVIPGVKGNTGLGIAMVKKSVERAVGSDIIFNEK